MLNSSLSIENSSHSGWRGTERWAGLWSSVIHTHFPGSSVSKESACSAGGLGSIPGSGRSPDEGNSKPLQYSCLENLMDRGTWQATVHGVARSQTQLASKPSPQCSEWQWTVWVSWKLTWGCLFIWISVYQNKPILKFLSSVLISFLKPFLKLLSFCPLNSKISTIISFWEYLHISES